MNREAPSSGALRRGSLFEGTAEADPAVSEDVSQLAARTGWRLERIVSRGHASAEGFWYDQDEDEFVLLVSGAARLELADSEVLELAPGDWVELPAHVRHRVAWTSTDEPAVWLTLFTRPEPAEPA